MDSRRVGAIIPIALSLIGLAVMVGALWPRGDAVRTDADRTQHVASRLRCPFCNGESIAEATSPVARDLEGVIGEQVAAGMTDDEIFEFFAARYGESLLLSPPLLGWGWALWALPLAAVLFGGVAVSRRRRRTVAIVAPGAGTLAEGRVIAQLDSVARDRAEVAQQVESGELDTPTAAGLISVLDAESHSLQAALADTPEPQAAARIVRRRAVIGSATVLLGCVVIAVTLLMSADDSGDGGIVDAPPIDFASVTPDQLEEVIAANPDIVPMRLALAQMLMDEGEVLRAAQHFGEVLDREDNPEAMAWLGWISYLAGEHETAEGFLEDALTLVPGYPQAQWWLGNVRLLGLGDPEGAIGPLEDLLGSNGVPDDVRKSAEQLLHQAREQR